MIRKTRKRAWADLVRDLDDAHALIRDRTSPIVRVRARLRARLRALDFEVVLLRDLDRDRDLDRAFALVNALIRDLDLVLDFDVVRVRDRFRALSLDLDSVSDGVVPDVVRLLESAQRSAARLADAAVKSVADGQRARVSGAARWLVGVASRVIPVSERARYAEEWQGELWELGRPTRGRRRRQLAHAFRLLSRTWGVRGGVRAARRRPAGG